MNWLKRRLQRWAMNDSIVEKESTISAGVRRSPRATGMNFTLYRANGGYILEYHQYNHKTDESDHKLHIIRDDQDLGTELAHIISFEALRA